MSSISKFIASAIYTNEEKILELARGRLCWRPAESAFVIEALNASPRTEDVAAATNALQKQDVYVCTVQSVRRSLLNDLHLVSLRVKQSAKTPEQLGEQLAFFLFGD